MRRLASIVSLSLGLLAAAAAAPVPDVAARAVRRGERVSLVARVGAVVAAVDAEALQDGGTGEVIRVRNLQNGKVLPARVIGAGQVEVTQ
jgi:flagella basal body P-ring formation protein FlgA